MEFETQKQDMKDIKQLVEEITKSIQKVIVGISDTIELLIISMICRGHILLEDVPGIGKTTLAKSLAQALGSSFSRIQCTPDLMPNDVLGVNFFNQNIYFLGQLTSFVYLDMTRFYLFLLPCFWGHGRHIHGP